MRTCESRGVSPWVHNAVAATGAAISVRSVVTNGVEVRWFEEMVPMKDGVRLYTYGALPAEGETRGIVFRRDPESVGDSPL